MKAHYLTEFMAANMTTESSNSDKAKEFVDEARRVQLEVRPPDVNASHRFFNVEEGAIRFGLGAIKGVGSRAADLIAEERGAGPFRSLEDLCERVDPTAMNKTALEALAKAGALESLGLTRRTALDSVDVAIRSAAQARDDRRKGQGLLFGVAATPPEPPQDSKSSEEWSEAERLAREKEALGFYLSGHPFQKRGKFYARLAGNTSGSLASLAAGTEVRIAGMLSSIRIMQIKSGRNAGQKMARLRLEDLEGIIEVTCFARTYQKVKDLLIEDAIVFATGRLDGESEETALLLDEVIKAQSVVDSEVHALVLRLGSEQMQDGTLDGIIAAIAAHPGDQRLLLEVQEGDEVFSIRTDARFSMRLTDELLDSLADLVGPSRLAFARR